MHSSFRSILVAAALVAMATPAFALSLPIIGDVEHPDFDPFHIFTPAPPPEAPAPAPKKMHHHHHHMKKA